LIDLAATNLAVRSQEFGDGAAWVVAGGTVTPNYALAPDGSKTAERYVWGANQYVIQSNNTTGFTTTRSVFLKGTSGSGSINIGVGGAVGQCKACPFTSTAWSRCEYTIAVGTVQANFFVGPEPTTGCGAVGDASGDVLVWGLQLEVNSVATSYIPTTTAQATRGADLASISFTPSPVTTGSMSTNVVLGPLNVNAGYFSAEASTTLKQSLIWFSGFKGYVGGSNTASATLVTTGAKRVVLYWDGSQSVVGVDGVFGTPGAAGTPAATDNLKLGNYSGGAGQVQPGRYSSFCYDTNPARCR